METTLGFDHRAGSLETSGGLLEACWRPYCTVGGGPLLHECGAPAQ